MDTETFIPIRHLQNGESIEIAELHTEEISCIETFVNRTRQIQDIHQLFSVFCFNKDSLLNRFTLMNSDIIIRTSSSLRDFDDFIAVNSLTINLISSGKTLVECMQRTNGLNVYWEKFNKYVKKIYDNNFSYRLLIRLRDFSHHGHLPVSFNDGRAGFDLAQIVNTPHFTHNSKLKREMQEIDQDILNSSGNGSHIMYTLTLAEFTVQVIKIYKFYISLIKQEIIQSLKEIKKLIKNRPEIVIRSNDFWNGDIVYKNNSDMLQAINTNDKTEEMLSIYEKEACQVYKKENNEFNRLYNSYSMKKICNRTKNRNND